MKTNTPKRTTKGVNVELKKLFAKQKTFTESFEKITKKLFENQSKINALLLEKTDFKIAKKIIQHDILTIEGACKFLKISKSTLQRRTNKGLPHTKDGKQVYYSRKAITAYLKAQEKINKTSIFD
jgi:excisionase family DNA binding protein